MLVLFLYIDNEKRVAVGPVVVSIVLQWMLIAGLVVVCLVTLAELGKLKSTVYAGTTSTGALTDSSGPAAGAALPSLDELASYHAELARHIGNKRRPILLCLFLSVGCESCHNLVDGINRLAEHNDMLDVLVIMRGSAEDVENFRNVFGLRVDLVPDETGIIALELFGIRHIPFGLVYGDDRTLQNKGLLVAGRQSIEGLLSDEGLLQERGPGVFSRDDAGAAV